MTTEPIAFLENTLPKMFTKGVAALRAKADAGDALATLRLDDCLAARGAGVVVLDGTGTVYLNTVEGGLSATREKPDAPIRIAVGCQADALEVALGEIVKESALEDPRVVEAVPALASK